MTRLTGAAVRLVWVTGGCYMISITVPALWWDTHFLRSRTSQPPLTKQIIRVRYTRPFKYGYGCVSVCMCVRLSARAHSDIVIQKTRKETTRTIQINHSIKNDKLLKGKWCDYSESNERNTIKPLGCFSNKRGIPI